MDPGWIGSILLFLEHIQTAFNECSEPSIATSIFENFEFSADNLVVKQTKTKDISINPQF